MTELSTEMVKNSSKVDFTIKATENQILSLIGGKKIKTNISKIIDS